MTALLKAIGVWHLTGYFEDLDEARASGRHNMSGGANILRELHLGMAKAEAHAVAKAWRDSFSESLPPEDRAAQVLE